MMAFSILFRVAGILLQISLVSSYNTEKSVCQKCSTIKNDEKCEKVECDFATKECIVYQYHDETVNTNVTVKDCVAQSYCSQLKSTVYKEALIMCNECTASNCNEELTTKSCVQCDGKWCDKDITEANSNAICSLDDTVYTECVAYRYLKGKDIFNYRGCASKNPCSKALSNVVSCKSCSDDKCNANIVLPADKTLCVDCNSLNDEECAKDDMNSKKIQTYCALDDSMECVAQKYLDISVGVMVTSRSCQPKDFCSTSKTVCTQCKETICNKKIDTKNEAVCVECENEEGSACAAENVDLKKVEFCSINVQQSECFAYKFLKEGKTITKRGCASKDSCIAMENEQANIISCNSCSEGINCNKNLSLTNEKTLCIQCSSINYGYCSADDMSWSKIKEYCSLDNATECVAYKYLDVSTNDIVTYRSCAAKNYCNSVLNSDNSNVTVCNECSESVCNKRIDQRNESILCAVCVGEKGSNCDSGVFSNEIAFCRLTDNEECVANKYISGNQLMTQRGCAPKDFCANTTSNSTVCKSCTDYNNCNLDLSLSDEATLCIQCTSQDDPECAKDDMNSAKVKEYCRLLDDSKNCVAYKFLNGLTGNLSTYRGCASTGYCEDAALSNNKTVCNECSGNICNKKIDTTKQQTLCVQCRGPNCDSNLNLSTTKYCPIDSKKKQECVAYTTLEGTKTITIKGCEAQGFCEDTKTASERKACKSCSDANICNSNLDLKDEKVLCVQCSSETDENCALDVMDPNKIKTHCKLDSDKNECIAYKYLDMKSNKKIIVRGCIAKEACANLPISTQYCSECTSDICNLNVVPVTTTTSTVSPTQSPGGAPSMTNLGSGFLILLASVSILA